MRASVPLGSGVDVVISSEEASLVATHRPLIECWPLETSGQLPRDILPIEFVGEAFFQTMAARNGWPASALRRGLKHMAKRLRIDFDRSNVSGSDLGRRDHELAFSFIDNPVGRANLHDVEVRIEMDGRHQLKEWVYRISRPLPVILWDRYVKDPEYAALAEWAKGISVERPELGQGYYITPEVLRQALDSGRLPPIALDDPIYARTLLLFSATLPRSEALELMKVGAASGAPFLAGVNAELSPHDELTEARAHSEEQEGSAAEFVPIEPRLETQPAQEIAPCAPPAPSSKAEALSSQLQGLDAARVAAAEKALQQLGPDPSKLIFVDEEGYEQLLAAFARGRSARTSFEAAIDAAREAVIQGFSSAFAAVQLELPEWLRDHCAKVNPEELARLIPVADVMQQMASEVGGNAVSSWQSKVRDYRTLDRVFEAFRLLPSLGAAAGREQEARRTFLQQTRVFLTASSANLIEPWLRKLSGPEISALLDEIDPVACAVPYAILFRLGLEADPEFFRYGEAQFRLVSRHERRQALVLVDPSSTAFDQSAALQRTIAVERLRDIIEVGPLALITDPSNRLADASVVGTPVAELSSLIVRHLDLIGSGADLRSLIQTRSGLRTDPAAELAQFAQTPSNSVGAFGLLRETARELLFMPTLRGGLVDPKAAARLHADFRLEDALEQVVEEARHRPAKQARIEPRHRVHLQRYLVYGHQLLAAYAGKIQSRSPSRLKVLKAELTSKFRRVGSSADEPGSQAWLESEVRKILIGESDREIAMPTLRGDAHPIAARPWTAGDTLWAQESLDLAEFYLPAQIGTLEVASVALKVWAEGRRSDTRDAVADLVERGEYNLALTVVDESVSDPDARTSLLSEVETAARGALAPLMARYDAIVAKQGATFVASLTMARAFEAAAGELDLRRAAEELELLEIEAAEHVVEHPPAREEEQQDEERRELVHVLLQAGVEGIDHGWTLADLQNRWRTELQLRVAERSHLRLLERALEPALDLPELSQEARDFSAMSKLPEHWLSADRSSELAGFIEESAEKLRTWLQLQADFEPGLRTSLVRLVRWFLKFIDEQAASLRALGAGEPSDHVLEYVLEASECILQAPNPRQSLEALSSIFELGPEREEENAEERELAGAPVVALPANLSLAASLAALAESSDWDALAEASRRLRIEASEEEARRLEDTAEFADTMAAIEEERFADAAGSLVTAARVLGASAQLINRSLPQTRQLNLAFRLLSCALIPAAVRGWKPGKPARDGSWRPLVEQRGELTQAFGTYSQASRVIEQLCAGALGREVVDRIWDAPTSSDPGPLRALFLSFLHERRLDEHLLFLAQRYEPAIRTRLAQLLELRAIAPQRPDLIPVSEAVAAQVRNAAQTVPFRIFVDRLPSAATAGEVDLKIAVEEDIILRFERKRPLDVSVAVSIHPHGLVPERLELSLFPEDDVAFEDGARRRILSEQPVYMARQWPVTVKFGPSWAEGPRRADSFRMRVNSRILAGELISRDVICQLTRADMQPAGAHRIDDDTLLEAYPGVENTPALGEAFVGRSDELERLHDALIGARRPSPVLLTGMRRIGKTSLLFAFHESHRRAQRERPVTVYFSLAEKRAALMDPGQDVGSVFFSAIAQALGKRHFSRNDHNRHVGEKLAEQFGREKDAVRNAILALRDRDSLSDSLTVLSEHLLDWLGGADRIVFLIDEAETLVLPYRAGGTKRLELEQFLQGLREISQTSPSVGLLLSGSNHIAEFARSYKNAFFGSSIQLDLGGMSEFDTARRIVAPEKLRPYVSFQEAAISYAIAMCAGMPQFMWQLGAATTAAVRSGPITKADVRRGVSALLGDRHVSLPFRAYDVLEPVEHMLGLQGQREQDLLWLLLWRVANASSLIADEAQQSVVIDQSLLELDEPEGWKARLLSLVDLDILELPRASMYRFRVPIFAEGFRAPRHQQTYHLRHQRSGT